MTNSYRSSKEIAEEWGVSQREVQRLLAEGRIPNARQYGRCWVIPAGTRKPPDPRTLRKSAPASQLCFYPVLRLPKGNAEAALASLTAPQRRLAEADLAYRRGDPEPSKACWHVVDRDGAEMLSAASLAIAAAISSGDYALYQEITRFLDARIQCAPDARTTALLSLPGIIANASMALRTNCPEWLLTCDFSMFDPDLWPFLLYLHTMHLRNVGDRAAQLATAHTTVLLCQRDDSFSWLEIQLWLLCASAANALGDSQQARRYLCTALELGIPCGFRMPFGDYLGELDGLMEECLMELYPQACKQVVGLWSESFKNWMRFHNEYAKENITTLLTPKEYHVARMLANGVSRAEIARRMNLSEGRVRNIASEVYGKLYIGKRSELKEMIL